MMVLLIGLYVGGIMGYILACILRIGSESDVMNEKQHVDFLSGNCPSCGEKLRNFGRVNYCWNCGQKLRWDGEIL